jgi:hypothetical protein
LHLRKRGAQVAGALGSLFALDDFEIGAQQLDREARVSEVAELASLVRQPQLLVAEAHQADHRLVGEVEGVQALELLADRPGALCVCRRAATALLVGHAGSSCISAVSGSEIA